MKNLVIRLLGLGVLVLPGSVLAGAGLKPVTNPTRISSRQDPEKFATEIINWFLGFVGLVAVAMFIYGGVLYLAAAGNDEQAGKGKKVMLYAVVGIIVILMAWTIVYAVTHGLGVIGNSTV